ncbi:hypothetical protein KUCAC02_023213, partial [Chaenocephalus aceratus]
PGRLPHINTLGPPLLQDMWTYGDGGAGVMGGTTDRSRKRCTGRTTSPSCSATILTVITGKDL